MNNKCDNCNSSCEATENSEQGKYRCNNCGITKHVNFETGYTTYIEND